MFNASTLSQLSRDANGEGMKIKEIISQNRRDFTAIFECEHCNAEVEKGGYDDNFFHSQIVPKMKCDSCGEVSPSSFRPLAAKYAEGVQV